MAFSPPIERALEMGHFVNASELAELCAELGLEAEEAAMIEATEHAAKAVAAKLGVAYSHTDNQPGFAGLCASFKPAHKGQPCPKALAVFDTGSDWAHRLSMDDPA